MIITGNGYVIYYNYGRFDQYCVHVLKPSNKRVWKPRDSEYFRWLKRMGGRYGNDKVYSDFLKLYEIINKDTSMFEIEQFVRNMYSDYVYGEEWWIILALTMKAEECKEHTILGKRIKHLAVYNLLMEDMKIRKIVSYMTGKRWWELDDLMMERGI